MMIYTYGDGGVSDNVRLVYPISNISQSKDFNFSITPNTLKDGMRIPKDQNGVYIFSRPMKPLVEPIRELKKSGFPIIFDIDDHFWSIPKEHVGYSAVGPKSENLLALESNLEFADMIVVSTDPLREYLISRKGVDEKKIITIANVCNSSSPFLGFERPSKYTRLGFSGTITHRQDFKLILKPLLKVLSEYQDTQIVIACDPEIYNMFSVVPEKRKKYLPGVAYDLYPIQVSYWDIMLIPLVSDTFNTYKSDIKILDAVANKKPFIASDVLPYRPYKDGAAGIVTSNDESAWYKSIVKMLDPKFRNKCISACSDVAKQHHVKNAASAWKTVIQEVLEKNGNLNR